MAHQLPFASSVSPEYALLGLMLQHPAHGYELHRRLTDELGQVWRISLSQTYNILNRLEAKGWIVGSVREQVGLPSQRRFRVTAGGRRRFDDWLRAPTRSSARAIRVEFLTRLYFARAVDPDLAAGLIDAQIDSTGASLARLEDMLADFPSERTFSRLGLELRVRQLSSILDWLRECGAAIR